MSDTLTVLETLKKSRQLVNVVIPSKTYENMMIEKVGDVPMIEVERRVRCIARPMSNKRGPACGGKMVLEFGGVGYAEGIALASQAEP